jgi:hypothetical protein
MRAKDLEIIPSSSGQTGNVSVSPFPLEPFVDAETVSSFLSVPRADVLRMTRDGKIRGYPYRGRLRHLYRYRLSEVSADFEAFACQPKRTIPKSSPCEPKETIQWLTE